VVTTQKSAASRTSGAIGRSAIVTFADLVVAIAMLAVILDQVDVGSLALQDVLVPFGGALLTLGAVSGAVLLLWRPARLVGIGALIGTAAAGLLGVSWVVLAATVLDDGPDPWLQPVAGERLVGAWQPVGMKAIEGTNDRWRLVFDEDGRWHGIDACSRTYGVFILYEDGKFDGGQTPDDFAGGGDCASESAEYYLVMGRTVRVDFVRDRAVFLAPDGDELMLLERLD